MVDVDFEVGVEDPVVVKFDNSKVYSDDGCVYSKSISIRGVGYGFCNPSVEESSNVMIFDVETN